jgi:hypothetical protein
LRISIHPKLKIVTNLILLGVEKEPELHEVAVGDDA